MTTINIPYELNNEQRKYFGLLPVEDDWNRQQLSDTICVYFNKNKIVKVLDYGWGYLEYDTDINTIDRQIVLPKTTRGKEQKLTIPRILKIKGSGIQFSGSFRGGNIHVYDNNRNLFFIKSFPEEGDMKNYQDIDNWVSKYMASISADYWEWLNDQLSQKKQKVRIKAGDIIAFKISKTEFGFALIISDVFADKRNNSINADKLNWFHPRSLIIAPYAFYTDTLAINIETLWDKKKLPTLCIFDLDVYRGQIPIIGHSPLSEEDRQIPFPTTSDTYATIPYSREYIASFISPL